jgi:hypothetical protein
MVTDTTKKLREPIAFGLLVVAALYLLSGLAVLFKSRDDLGISFTGRAALVSHVFTDPVLVIALVAAVVLVAAGGQASRNARVVVLTALAIGAVCLLFALISWLAGLSADGINAYGGVNGAGRIVGIFLGLAQVIFLALALAYVFSVFQSLPKPASSADGWRSGQQVWGAPQQPQQWEQHQQQQQQWGPPPQQPGWGQQPQQWGPPQQQGWGQPAQPQQPEQVEQPQQPQQPWAQQESSWGDSPGTTAPAGSGWDEPAAPPVFGPPSETDPEPQSTWDPPDETPREADEPPSDSDQDGWWRPNNPQ